MSTLTRPLGLRAFLNAFLALGAFFILGIASVSAAAPQGTMTGTAKSISTGLSANAINTITVTDFSTAEITATNDIRIKIPSTVNAHWDTTDTSATIVNPATGVVDGTVSYNGNNILILNVTTNFGNNEAVQISALGIIGDAASAAAALQWSIDGGTAYGTGNSNTNITVTATDAAATLTLADAAVGATQSTTLTLTLSVPMANTDTVTFTAPDELDLTNLASAVTGTLEGSSNITCAAVSQAVTCTIDGGSAAAASGLTIIMTGITGKYVGTTDISDLAINDTSLSGADINSDTTVAMTNTTVGALTSVTFVPTSYANSSLVNYAVNFTTVGTTMANAAKVVIVFPTGYDLSGISTTVDHLSGLDGTWTASRSSQTVTITQSGGGTTSPGAKSLTLYAVRNPAATGATAAFSITTQTSAAANIQTHTSGTVTVVGGSSSASELGDISDISVTDGDDGSVVITWADPSDDTSYVQILKGTAPYPVNGTVYATVAVGTETYTDTDVEAGDVVTYQLRGTDGTDTGDLSEEVSFTVGSGETTTSTDDSTDDSTSDDSTDDSTSDDSTDDSTSASDMFSDEIPTWAENAITVLADAGVVEGNPDGTFNASGDLNRAEAAAMLWRVLMMGDPTGADEMPFDDVELNEWFTDYVSSLKGLGLVDGNPDGTYEPGESINRAEFLTLAMNVYVYLNSDVDVDTVSTTSAYADLDTSAWYAQTVSAATEWGFVEGSACDAGTCFNAGDEINRAEASQMLYNMFGTSL